jgi:hypothetical protein
MMDGWSVTNSEAGADISNFSPITKDFRFKFKTDAEILKTV